MGVEGITGLDDQLLGDGQPRRLPRPRRRRRRRELNVRDRIPVGLPHDDVYRYIEPGTRTLDGIDTLWFARAREGSDDYSRMARQKCVMNAMLQQVSPQDGAAQLREDRQAHRRR